MLLKALFLLSLHASAQVIFNRESGAYFDPSVNLGLKPISHAWSALRRDWYKVIGTVLVQQYNLPSSVQPSAWIYFSIVSTMPSDRKSVV